MKLLIKFLTAAIFVLVGLYLLGTLYASFIPPHQMIFGVSFSPRYAAELGLDPKITFQDILTNLKVKNIRLSAYWDEIEPKENQFDFANLDYYVNQATKANAQVILVIGHKVPRWPECFAPNWVYHQTPNNYDRLRTLQLNMLTETIKHFNNNSTIKAFQLENEPLLDFGICPLGDREFLKKEVDLVRFLTKKPIILSDSGELRSWVTSMKLSDIFGTTLYRTVRTPFNFDFTYPFPPIFYSLKSTLVRNLFAPQNQKTIIIELQAEPWLLKGIAQTPIEEQIKIFKLQDLQNNIEFAEKTGFGQAYLWGVEWWYFMAKSGHPEYLEYIKKLSLDAGNAIKFGTF